MKKKGNVRLSYNEPLAKRQIERPKTAETIVYIYITITMKKIEYYTRPRAALHWQVDINLLSHEITNCSRYLNADCFHRARREVAVVAKVAASQEVVTGYRGITY